MFPSAPAPDIAHFYAPPYFTFWEGNSTASIRASHDWLIRKLARDGPYDGVLLFSQGCGLIASFLLYHQAANPGTPAPFKVAVFICGGLALHVLEDLGVEVGQEAHDWDHQTRIQLQKKNNALTVLSLGKDRWGSAMEGDLTFDSSMQVDLQNVFGLNISLLPANLRIRIPNVHIYGSRDPRFPASLQLAHLCDGEVRKVYDHGGGHDIPRSKEVSETIAGLVRWSVCMAGKDQS